MILARERELLVRFAARLVPDGLAVETGGNLSVRAGDLVAVTPRGVDYGALTPERIAVVALDGAQVDGELAASTELPMHLAVYGRTAAAAVVHTHSPFATALGVVGVELPPVHYLVAVLGGPVRVAPYATPGSDELADAMAAGLEGRSAVLLGNHGAIATGTTLERAYSGAVLLEWLCALWWRARALGEPRLLPQEEIARVEGLMRNYLQEVPES